MTEPEHTAHPSLIVISPAEKGDEVFQLPFSFSCSFLFPDIKLFGLLLFHNLSGLGLQVGLGWVGGDYGPWIKK